MKSLLTLVTLIVGVASLQAEIILDEAMPRSVQKSTGVSKLSRREKLALETWLNQTCVLKTEAQKAGTTPLSLSININQGQKLQLSDNSVWDIDPADKALAAAWITPTPVKIVSSGNTAYPYAIINTTTGASVKAKLEMSQTPAETQMPLPAKE